MGIAMAAMWSPVYAQESTCVTCHMVVDTEELKWAESDVHIRQGIGCETCHGGDPTAEDPEEAKSPARGYVGVPTRSQIPQFCGTCHQDVAYIHKFNPDLRTDQLSLYWTSTHGQKLRAGDEKVATCVDCHTHHGILSVSDVQSPVFPVNVPETCGRCHSDPEHMAGYDIPTDQKEKFLRSVHGQLLLERGGKGAPTCAVCHGSHGAARPRVSVTSTVCGQCHSLNAGFVAKSPHAAPFEAQNLSACESCHNHHEVLSPSDEMLGTGDASACISCHDQNSEAYGVSIAMKASIDGLINRRAQANALLSRAERAGMEVRDAKFELDTVDNILIKARTAIHSLSPDIVKGITAEGDSLTGVAVVRGEQAMADLQFRRMGLGISLIIILVVSVALFFKIREEDRRRGPR